MTPYPEIARFLSERDPVLRQVIDSVNTAIMPSLSIDIYLELLNAIASQQLSVKVVKVIWNRFTELFTDGYPHAVQLLNYSDQELRSVGLSFAKIKYIKSVAEFSLTNKLSFEFLNTMSDDAVINYLTQINGVGKWTVQMILMFPMDRPNVFPVDDLGIQTHMKHWYGLTLEKKALRTQLIEIAEKWDPYKTLACKYLWESKEQ
jgi:DNA-3-methyladenine glycosylase II